MSERNLKGQFTFKWFQLINMGYFLTMQTCKEFVTDSDYLDVTFETNAFSSTPRVTATTDTNVNVFVSDITALGCKLNFSEKYTGYVYLTSMVTA